MDIKNNEEKNIQEIDTKNQNITPNELPNNSEVKPKSNVLDKVPKAIINPSSFDNIDDNNKKIQVSDVSLPLLKNESGVLKKDESEKPVKQHPTFNFVEMCVLVIITGIMSAVASGVIVERKNITDNGISYKKLLEDDNLKEFLNVYATISNDYYENIDKKSAIDGAISGLMDYVGDNYTSYLDKDDASALNESLKGTYKGIGVSISSSDPGTIVKVYKNSPASDAGLLAQDKIISINNQDTTSLSSAELTKLIKEADENVLNLTIKRDEEIFTVTVTPRMLNTPCISNQVLEVNDHKIGYLLIESFTNTLQTQVSEALQEMEQEGIESLILDLRNNGGGLLSAAEETTNLFLENGKVIYSLEDENKTVYDRTDEKRTYPIIVLVNGATASASEILTSALKDSYGATIVGTTTYGKGKVQRTKNLKDGSLVKYTTSRWLTPNNECIDTYGINPDYNIELDYQYDEAGNVTGATDTQFNKALELLTQSSEDNPNRATN